MVGFINKLRRVKLADVLDLWKLPVSALASFFYRYRHPDKWIVCEDPMEARDNGYWFFKYVRENHPEQEIVYAIKRASVDYDKVAAFGDTVEFGSLRHWIIYFASSKKISSQKAGNPNAALFYFLEVSGLLNDVRIFLQHGVIKDDLEWLYYPVTKMARFICGAFPEYEYVRDRFGYPEGHVVYTGLCRFDGLHAAVADQSLILIMPTWREWIADEDQRLQKYEGTSSFSETNYFKKWQEFITSPELYRIAKEYNVRFVFYPHRNMQKYLSFFPDSTSEVEILGAKDCDVQGLIKLASLMITDYSSVFFDFVYMKKPVLFYQFDYEEFRQGQYGEGYFDYRSNPFGKSYSDSQSVFHEIKCVIERQYRVSDDFLEAHAQYFPHYDERNCERVYNTVKTA